jgi:hypothetical protein
MEIQFRNFDLAIATQPMPPEYRDVRAIISCNDCSAKSQTAYHWLGLKCTICDSYNTVQQQILDAPSTAAEGRQGDGIIDTPAEAGLGPQEPGPRDIPWPANTSIHRRGGSIGSREDLPSFSPFLVPTRLASSVSPVPTPPMVNGLTTDESDDDYEEDTLDFWGGNDLSNVTTSGGSALGNDSLADDEEDDDDLSDSSDDCAADLDDDDEDDEDEDEISLFGHR